MFDLLPTHVKEDAYKAFELFKRNEFHSGLRFKELTGFSGYWSVRVGISYRAVCKRDGNTLYWLWIGTHAEFDRDFA
jgi:hypothetical protein